MHILMVEANITHTITVIPTNESYNNVSDNITFVDQSLGHVLIGLNDNDEQQLDIVMVLILVWCVVIHTLCEISFYITTRFLVTLMWIMIMLQ